MFLCVQNPGVAPVEGFTLLGVSTSRGETGTIGQFGSGAKHAINTLLRGSEADDRLRKNALKITTRDETVNDGLVTKAIKRVVCKLGGTSSKTLDMGWCLDFGSIDWTDLSMALREFVANAVDRTVREKTDFLPSLHNGDLRVMIVEDRRAGRGGYTRVYVEASPDVQRFYGELPRRFLHFSPRPVVGQGVAPAEGRSQSRGQTAMIYKEGVFVREIEGEAASIYDYNFHGDELQLDESRNSSEYEVKASAAQLFRKATAGQMVEVFKSLLAQQKTYEASFDGFYVARTWGEIEPEQKAAWQKGWEFAAGPDTVMCDALLTHTIEFVRRKGFCPKPIEATSWLMAAQRCGIKTVFSVLDGYERGGQEIIPATSAAVEAVNIVWSWLQQVNMIQGKQKPAVACFRQCMEAGEELMGFYRDGTVYLKEGIAGKYVLRVALEEVVHYVAGATDMSRDFQNFLTQTIVEIKQ